MLVKCGKDCRPPRVADTCLVCQQAQQRYAALVICINTIFFLSTFSFSSLLSAALGLGFARSCIDYFLSRPAMLERDLAIGGGVSVRLSSLTQN